MIVSVWPNILLLGNFQNIKKHIRNAVEYAISEGGRMFLSESGTEFADMLGEVLKEYPDVIHAPVDKKDLEAESVFVGSTSREISLKSYLSEKADFVIIIDSKDTVGEFPKTTLRIKI